VEFGNAATAAYRQIMDLIDRYQRFDAAIVASDAATTVKTGYGVNSLWPVALHFETV
jgi:hypothetical protein